MSKWAKLKRAAQGCGDILTLLNKKKRKEDSSSGGSPARTASEAPTSASSASAPLTSPREDDDSDPDNPESGRNAAPMDLTDVSVNDDVNSSMPVPAPEQPCPCPLDAVSHMPNSTESGRNTNSPNKCDLMDVDTDNGKPIPDEPFQPKEVPPQLTARRAHHFGKDRFKAHPWLHYDSEQKKVFCLCCLKATNLKLVPTEIKMEPAFIVDGFGNWKKGKARFERHQASEYHKRSIEGLKCVRQQPVSAQLSTIAQKQQALARQCLCKIFSTLRFLGRQGLAVRGKRQEDGNFYRLLKLRGEDVPELLEWLSHKYSYTSGEIQNEVLGIIANRILRQLADEIRSASMYSIILDETSDITTQEQVSICLRIVDEELLKAKELFLGLYQTSSTTGETLFKILMDVLNRLNILIEKCRGQCYDGASSMRGAERGVQARVRELQKLAIYVHCCAHSLNLALQDTVKEIPLMRDALQWTHEVGKILKKSPKQKGIFEDLRKTFSEDKGVGPTTLCPTRFVVRVASISGTLNTYESTLKLTKDLGNSTEKIGSKARGLHDQLKKESVYFSLLLARSVFDPCERLSCVLQSSDRTLASAKSAVTSTLTTLHDIKENKFEDLFAEMKSASEKYGLIGKNLDRGSREVRRPQRLIEEDGSSSSQKAGGVLQHPASEKPKNPPQPNEKRSKADPTKAPRVRAKGPGKPTKAVKKSTLPPRDSQASSLSSTSQEDLSDLPPRRESADIANNVDEEKEKLRKSFHQVLDALTSEIERRFKQPGFEEFVLLESALTQPPCEWDDGLAEVLTERGIDAPTLQSEIQSFVLVSGGQPTGLEDARTKFLALDSSTRLLFPAIKSLLINLIVVPASSCTSERSHSVMRRVKDYLRSTMSQERLNHCCLLAAYPEMVDNLDDQVLAQEFINKDRRKSVFGSF